LLRCVNEENKPKFAIALPLHSHVVFNDNFFSNILQIQKFHFPRVWVCRMRFFPCIKEIIFRYCFSGSMCFIEFNSKDEKEAAYEKKDELELDGRSVYLDVLNSGGRGGGRGGRQGFGRGGRGDGLGQDSFGHQGSRGPCHNLL